MMKGGLKGLPQESSRLRDKQGEAGAADEIGYGFAVQVASEMVEHQRRQDHCFTAAPVEFFKDGGAHIGPDIFEGQQAHAVDISAEGEIFERGGGQGGYIKFF